MALKPLQLEPDAAPKVPLLPPELPWICLLVPLATTPLVRPGFLNESWPQMLRSFLAMELAFVGIPLGFQVFYKYVATPVLQGRPRLFWPFHVVAALVLGPLFGEVVRPFHNLICLDPVPRLDFAVISTVFSCLCLWPAVAYQRLRTRAQAVERQAHLERQSALKAQLEALQSRTNPHFFFNSINTALSLIPEDPKLAEQTLERLAELFRYALDASKTRTVSLAREVEVVEDYLAIQRARFAGRLTSHVELDTAAAQVAVPPLLLQPLVENAILHGLNERAKGEVSVRIRRESDKVHIDVTDDGPGPGASSHRGSGTSMRDLKARLELLYGAAGRFELLKGEAGGCVARLELPVEALPA